MPLTGYRATGTFGFGHGNSDGTYVFAACLCGVSENCGEQTEGGQRDREIRERRRENIRTYTQKNREREG
eukprot:735453-Amorphochlora_amoeboformis.AAC.1